MGRNGEALRQRELALLEPFESEVEGHHLGQRRRIVAPVRRMLGQDLAAIGIDHDRRIPGLRRLARRDQQRRQSRHCQCPESEAVDPDHSCQNCHSHSPATTTHQRFNAQDIKEMLEFLSSFSLGEVAPCGAKILRMFARDAATGPRTAPTAAPIALHKFPCRKVIPKHIIYVALQYGCRRRRRITHLRSMDGCQTEEGQTVPATLPGPISSEFATAPGLEAAVSAIASNCSPISAARTSPR